MATIDLTQFHEVFFEESYEGLETMEAGLLNLDTDSPDAEIINDMFRAAHSIKGGAGTFGFQWIADFTHVVESILDGARSDPSTIDDALVQRLLESVDFLRSMLGKAKADEVIPPEEIEAFVARLTGDAPAEIAASAQIPASEPPAAAEEAGAGASVAADDADEETVDAAGTTWYIEFNANPELFIAGHDPFRLFRELASMGNLDVSLQPVKLPAYADMSPENCYFSWNLVLTGDVPREEIESVFEWIDEEASITISDTPGDDRAEAESAAASDTVPETEAVETSRETEAEATPDEAPAELPAQAAEETTRPEPPTAQATEEPAPAAPAQRTPSRTEKQEPAPTPAVPEATSTSIRVNIERVDQLVNLVGELVITQSMISRFKERLQGSDFAELIHGIEQLEENTRELQDRTMQIRMLPIDSVFQRLPRLVRDVSRNLGKTVDLEVSGNTTEVDKTVLEKITDPLTHLVRNSLDHGIESKDNRLAAGKPATGKISVKAYHEGGSIVIEVADDGAGLDRSRIRAKAIEKGIIEPDSELNDSQVDQLIFAPGFSTAETVSDVSGRGVGMDVVKKNIEHLSGNISVSSETGVGSRFTIRLPLTLSIIDGQLVRIGNDIFVIPLLSIIESTNIQEAQYGEIAEDTEMYRFQGDYIRIARLDQVYGIKAEYTDARNAIMIIVSAQERFGVLVDEVLGQQQVVVKSLQTNFKLVPTVSGATILGDGTVAMILDIASLHREAFEVSNEEEAWKLTK